VCALSRIEVTLSRLPFEISHDRPSKKPTPAHERKVELPEQLSAIVSRLLKKNAEDL
jgi:hypothetical protein